MASLRGVVARLRGGRDQRFDRIDHDLAELREHVLVMNHAVQHNADAVGGLREAVDALRASVERVETAVAKLDGLAETQQRVLFEFVHDVRSGAEDALPLFLGYTERLRLDTDTAIGASQVIERQLALLEDLVAAGREPDPT